MSYQAPATAQERIKSFNEFVEEFKEEYANLTVKQKKVSAHRSRKALLCIAKLTRFIRNDIKIYAETLSKKSEKAASSESTDVPAENVDVPAPEVLSETKTDNGDVA
jgi:hypothetical protein